MNVGRMPSGREISLNPQIVSTILTVTIPSLTVLVGILLNNSRLTDLRSYMDQRFHTMDIRFDAMEKLFTEKLLRVEQVMDARIKHLEDNQH